MTPKPPQPLTTISLNGWAILANLVAFADVALRPSAYVFGRAQLRTARCLERRGWVELRKNEGRWVAHLTATGKHALDAGSNPELFWAKSWNGTWYLFLFDLPEQQRKRRQQLHTWLRKERFGCLQGSLWLAAHPPNPSALETIREQTDPSCFLLAEAQVISGASAKEIVSAAWDFDAINQGYQDFLQKLRALSTQNRACRLAHAVQGWALASQFDPFLPSQLLPRGYLGKKAWKLRTAILSEA